MPYFVFFLLFAVSGCEVLDLDVDVAIEEQRINGFDPLTTLLPVPFDLDVDLEAETQARNTGPAQGVRAKAMFLQITNTAIGTDDVDTFDFASSVTIFISSMQEDSSLPKIPVATLSPVPRTRRRIVLDVNSGLDLRPYIDEGAVLDSVARGSTPDDDVTLDGVLTLSYEVLRSSS